MSEPIIHLENYFLEKVHIQRHHTEEERNSSQITVSFDFDYKIQRSDNDPLLFLLTFIVRDDPKAKTKHPQVYTLDIHLLGAFRFDADVPEDQMQYLIRYNGCAILYGILRGMVTNITAAFPEGPIRMPTKMISDIVKKVEGLEAKPTVKKKAARKAVKKKAKNVSKKK